MKYEKYNLITSSSDSFEFSFVSIGPNGIIEKLVLFQRTEVPGIFNLCFGDRLEEGGIDDQVINDNKDRNKILATVAATVYEFTATHPGCGVFFKGNSPERTRLYRMALSTNLRELEVDFDIYGVNWERNSYLAEPFVNGRDYFGFLIERKMG